jgi:streptogramin lyase
MLPSAHVFSVRAALSAAMLAAVLFLGGCAANGMIRLLYSPATPEVLPAPTAPHIVVVLFEDKRNKTEIGVTRKGTPLTAGSPVSEWISRSLAVEISRMGPQVSFAPSMPLAQSARPAFIVSGSVEEVWLTETNLASYNAAVRLNVRMANRQGTVYEQNLSSSQEKTGMPGSTLAETLLADTVREVLGVAASKISEAAR